jgi:hypothetical protein
VNWRVLAVRVVLSLFLPLAMLIMVVRISQELVRGPHGQFGSDMVVGELIGGTVVGQTFVAEAEGLYRVDVLLATYARRNSGPIIFHLRPSPAATTDLVTLQIDAAQVHDNTFHPFEFEPLSNVKGESFYFYLEAPEARPGNAISVWASSQDNYALGQAVALWPLSDRAQDLAFSGYYRTSTWRAFRATLDRLTVDKPGLFGARGWYVALGGIYLALLFWLGWSLGAQFGEQFSSKTTEDRGISESR